MLTATDEKQSSSLIYHLRSQSKLQYVSSCGLDCVQGECKESGENAVTVLITFAASCRLCEIQYKPITTVDCDKRVTVVSKRARFEKLCSGTKYYPYFILLAA